MGSFLVSCCVTNQTITEVDEVYIIPIFENKNITKVSKNLSVQGLGRLIYNTGLYGLLGFIFTGTYADYGRYEINWDKKENKYMLEKYLAFLAENSLAIPQGENTFHDVPALVGSLVLTDDNHEEIWNYIHEAIWEGRLFLDKNHYSGGHIYSKVEYFIAKKESVDILLNMYNNKPEQSYYYSEEYRAFDKLTTEEKAKKLFDDTVVKLDTPVPVLEEDNEESKKLYLAYVREEFSTDNSQPLHFLTDNSFTVAYSLGKYARKELVQSLRNDYETYSKVYNLFATLKNLAISMMHCNIIFRPVYYASQDYGNVLGSRFSYFMTLVHQQNIKRFDNFEEDFDDEVDDDTYQKQQELQLEKYARDFSY